MFRFKQFSIQDEACAMKVGTDGVLLGAWAELPESGCCLDVGTGSGLIALMLAQRFEKAQVTAIEIEREAAEQAEKNVLNSPFSNRVVVMNADFLTLPISPHSVVAIVSNPPFFEETLQSPNLQRAQARHNAAGLPFSSFVQRAGELLAENGMLQVILPKSGQSYFHELCNRVGFSLLRQTDVRTVAHKMPKRVLLHFVKGRVEDLPKRNELILMQEGQRSPAYQQLCEEFYL